MTIFVLGLALMLLGLGGISLDLWRSFSERRSLASAADAAALAGAGALDVERYRRDGTVRLVPGEAIRRARASVADQLDVAALRSAHVAADERSVQVQLTGRVELTLLRVFAGGRPVVIEVRAVAEPVASP